MLSCPVGLVVFDQSKNEVTIYAWRKVRGVSGCLPVEIQIGGGDRSCAAESQKTRANGFPSLVKASVAVLSAFLECILNDHSTIMGRRIQGRSGPK
jgi:hypothetical protein